MLDSTGRDRAALVQVDAASGAKTVLGESARADVSDVWLDPVTNAPEAFGADYLRREWRALDPDAQADLDFLDRQLTGEFSVVSRSADDNRWIVVEEGPATSARSYLYDRTDRANRRLTLLFRHRPNLEQAPLQAMTPVEIEARDGLTLVSYLTLPIESDPNNDARPTTPVPLVVMAHDGPWARDTYGFNAMHQWLANRGYAVLSVNFRGSTGLGKAFLNAGNREWGGKIEEDLIDAVQWAISNGVAQADHIAIIGSGFGGYAALESLSDAPQQFRCGAAFGGPANLATMIDAAAAPLRDELYLRVGDARTPEGRQLLRDQSPIMRASQITRPVLLALGAHDAGASRAEFDYIAQSLRGRRLPLTYVVFPEDGRDLAPPDRLAFAAVMEHFLGACLGGRVEAAGAAFDGAQMQVFDGASRMPGLGAFARRPPAPPPAAAEVDEQTPEADGEGGPEDAPLPPGDATTETAAPAPVSTTTP
jgi:dipeptidyl aminopeptidase/acylaminoacyl peptidase